MSLSYRNFEDLTNRNFTPTVTEILTVLSTDLHSIDVKILFKNATIIQNSNLNDKDFYRELAILCKDKSYAHFQWSLLAGRIRMCFIKRTVPTSFDALLDVMKDGLDPNYYNFCKINALKLEAIIKPQYDWNFDIFGVETLINSYLNKDKNKNILETPQFLYLRIATFLWFSFGKEDFSSKDFASITQTYEDFALGRVSGPSPLQFNAGMKKHQLSSCFLMSVDDSMDAIKKSWSDSATISQNQGAVGISFDSLRHSEIAGQGWSKGIVPWAKTIESVLYAVDQGSKRKGAGTIWLCDWHIDIFEFVELKDPIGNPALRAKDLFYGVVVSDLFMRRVREDKMWSIVCPAKAQQLEEKYGDTFETEYLRVEELGLAGKIPNAFKHVKARDLWLHILKMQIKTGMPFILYKDAVNRKSNQANLGTIRCSNLCCEIVEFTDTTNLASCNLMSIPVSKFVTPERTFDFDALGEVTRRVVRMMGQIVNRNFYPTNAPEIKSTNLKHRPVGIGIQDLAGCFALMDLCWDSKEARHLNEQIAMIMYYCGMDENVKMAQEFGCYDSFIGSPASRGLFQFDLWNKEKGITSFANPIPEFVQLRRRMMEHGLYFSLLFAQMPTASSAQILGNNESIEPYTQLLFARTVLSGQFTVTVPHFVRDLEEIGLWNNAVLRHLINNQGSIQTFTQEGLDEKVMERLQYLKRKYRTSFELSQKVIADLYLSRAPFQCQTSSNNVFMKDPTLISLSAYHFYMWKNGAKTGMYYLRQTPGTEPLNFAVNSLSVGTKVEKDKVVCTDEICTVCSS